MNEFIKQFELNNPQYNVNEVTDMLGDMYNLFKETYPDKNVSKLRFVKYCSEGEYYNMSIACGIFLYKKQILVYHFNDAFWSEVEYVTRNICGYNCVMYSNDIIIPVQVISKILFDDENLDCISLDRNNYECGTPFDVNINSSYKLTATDEYKNDSILIEKDGEIVFEFKDLEYKYMTSTDEMELYRYGTNLFIYYYGDIYGCIVIKNLLD